MLLALDIGNTNIVAAIYIGDSISNMWRVQTDAGRTADEYAALFLPLFHEAGMEKEELEHVIISSVVPQVDWQIKQFCKKYLPHDPVFVSYANAGLEVDLSRPESAGADRLVNAAGVLAYYDAPAIVIDFGTATTFDVINKNGAYAGGVIAPGPNLSLQALHMAAAKLPNIAIEKPDRAIAKTTISAMQSGVYWGYVGLINGLLDKMFEEFPDGAIPSVIATGGLAKLFAQDLPRIEIVDDHLTLKGLLAIHKQLK